MKRSRIVRRTPLERGISQLARTPINPISSKRRRNLPTRTQVRADVLNRDNHQCQAAALVPEVECREPLDVHEIIPRSAWPDGWLIPDNCLTVCRNHHTWIGFHPRAAADLGLHRFSWDRPL